MTSDTLASRTISTYPLSIGTSLAMESISMGSLPAYDAERKVPDAVKLTEYDSMYVNLATLHRNIIGAVGSQNAGALTKKDLAYTLNQEVEIIKEIVREQNPSIKLVFYVCGNEGMESKYPQAIFRQNSTVKQIAAQQLLQDSLSLLLRQYKDLHESAHDSVQLLYQKGMLDLGKSKKTLLITHQAIDLLAGVHGHSVDLLESHTGVLKTKAQFHTKFHEGRSLVRIPFNAAMLVVFGDSQTFVPWKRVIRDEVIEIAEKYRWTYMTTPMRMRINLHDLRDELAEDVILSML